LFKVQLSAQNLQLKKNKNKNKKQQPHKTFNCFCAVLAFFSHCTDPHTGFPPLGEYSVKSWLEPMVLMGMTCLLVLCSYLL